jgi:hypothetical protein
MKAELGTPKVFASRVAPFDFAQGRLQQSVARI